MPTHLRRYDEPGDCHFWTISCQRRLTFFQDDGLKRIVTDGLGVLRQRFGVCLIGYVIMPEHVHVIVYPHVRGYDFNVRTHKAFLQKLDYCHKNPLTRGLVDRAEDWPWSSYRYYEFEDESVLRMDWDGSWPIIW